MSLSHSGRTIRTPYSRFYQPAGIAFAILIGSVPHSVAACGPLRPSATIGTVQRVAQATAWFVFGAGTAQTRSSGIVLPRRRTTVCDIPPPLLDCHVSEDRILLTNGNLSLLLQCGVRNATFCCHGHTLALRVTTHSSRYRSCESAVPTLVPGPLMEYPYLSQRFCPIPNRGLSGI